MERERSILVCHCHHHTLLTNIIQKANSVYLVASSKYKSSTGHETELKASGGASGYRYAVYIWSWTTAPDIRIRTTLLFREAFWVLLSPLGPVVQSPISVNPGLSLNKTYRVNPGSALIGRWITGPWRLDQRLKAPVHGGCGKRR